MTWKFSLTHPSRVMSNIHQRIRVPEPIIGWVFHVERSLNTPRLHGRLYRGNGPKMRDTSNVDGALGRLADSEQLDSGVSGHPWDAFVSNF